MKKFLFICSLGVIVAITSLGLGGNIIKQNISSKSADNKGIINSNIDNNTSISIVKTTANITKLYDTVDKLKLDADIIIEGEVLDLSYFDRKEATFTKSLIKVTRSYNGNAKAGDIINLVEAGGITTQDAINKYSHYEEKFGKLSNTEREEAKVKKVKVEFDIATTVQKGEEIFLFAKNEKDFFGEDVYFPLGTYQGKFLIKDTKLERNFSEEIDPLKLIKADMEKKLQP
ncbi:MAG: hypothetical protein MUO60_08965 [Clostridiaceae bacterium]|nr:hypothetical protein [Clostridiaceae bacterium]